MQQLAGPTSKAGKHVQCVRFLSSDPSLSNFRAGRLANSSVNTTPKPGNTPTTRKLPSRNSYGSADSSIHLEGTKASGAGHPLIPSNIKDLGHSDSGPNKNAQTTLDLLMEEYSLAGRLARRQTETSPSQSRPRNVMNFNPLRRSVEDQPARQTGQRVGGTAWVIQPDGRRKSGSGQLRDPPKSDAGRGPELRWDRQKSRSNAAPNQPHKKSALSHRRQPPSETVVESFPSKHGSTDVKNPSYHTPDLPVKTQFRRTDLVRLFESTTGSNTRGKFRIQSFLERQGGDYSGYFPEGLNGDANPLGPVQNAQFTLARRRDIGRHGRSRILEIIKRSVGSDNIDTPIMQISEDRDCRQVVG